MKNDFPAEAARDSRSGIALIIVLGFLSILIIMSVGFAISMRVERLVSRSSLDHIRALQLGEAALARIAWDVNDDLGDELFANWSGNWLGGAFESIGSGDKAGNFIDGYATNYIPLSLWTSATGAAANAEWLPFDYIDNGQKRLVGRYAYVVLDCSGLLDVNFDYSPTNNLPLPRVFGESVYELQLTNELLREIRANGTPRVWTNLMFSRLGVNGMAVTKKPWIRLETIAEFNPMLTHGSGFNGQHPMGNDTVRGTNSVNFITYSRIPRGYLEGAAIEQPLTITDPLDQSALESAFSHMGLPDPAGFVRNLVDYTDENNVPVNIDSYCTEAVPLINELVISNSYTDVGGGTSVMYRNEYRMIAELWYPFSNSNTNNYSVRLIAQYNGVTPKPGVINQTLPVTAPGGTWSMGDFLTVTSTPQAMVTNILLNLGNAVVLASARVLEGGTEVDRVGGSAATLASIPIGTRMTGPVPIISSLGKSANDPRLNWDGANSAQWVQQNNHTLGRTNDASVTTFASAGADGHTAMYVANRPLKAVGELGLLLFDANKPWQTISLLNGPTYYPVLDRFTLRTNDVLHGLVNPNGYNSNVIATVFNSMPVERVPGDPSVTNFNIFQLRALAGRFTDKYISITNLSDLKHIGPQVTAAMPGLPVTMHESIVRNSAGLFSPRQQLFAVFLIVQVQDADKNVMAEQRGTGLIWRDPYIASNNTHAVMVRNFRWLTE